MGGSTAKKTKNTQPVKLLQTKSSESGSAVNGRLYRGSDLFSRHRNVSNWQLKTTTINNVKMAAASPRGLFWSFPVGLEMMG